MNLLRLRPRDGFCDPGRRHAELARRIGEGEPALRYQVHREVGLDGRDVATAPSHAEFLVAPPWVFTRDEPRAELLAPEPP